VIGIDGRERLPQRGVDLRHGLPDPGHHREAAFHFVEHARPRGSEKLALPEHGEFRVHLGLEPPSFAGQKVGMVEGLEALPHPPQLGPDASPLGLAGVGGEHELHAQPVKRGLDGVGRQTPLLKLGHAAGERLLERQRIPLPLPVPQHADPLPILGDVHQIEEHAEGPGDDLSLPVVEAGDPLVEGDAGCLVAGPPIAGQAADFLNQRECLRAFEFPDHAPEHVAEQADIATEEFVIDHGSVFQAGLGGEGRGADRDRPA